MKREGVPPGTTPDDLCGVGPSGLTDQQPSADRIEWRLQRFVEGETARTIYKLPQNGRLDPQRQDVASLLSELQWLRLEREDAQREATQLAAWLHRNFYSEVTQWRPLTDPAGVVSQIDNMVSGVVERLRQAEARLSKSQSALQPIPDAER